MNKVQTNQMRMFLNTQETMDANSELWNMIPVVLNTKNEFDELLQRIETVNGKTVVNSKAVTINKNRVLQNLIEKAVVLSGTLQAYAAYANNTVMANNLKLTKSDITKIRETDVEAAIAPVIKAAQKELDKLADFGITEAMITELQTSLDDFKSLIGQPRIVRNQAFAAMTFMDELFDATNEVVKNKLDKLMIRFKYSNTEFYSKYERARTIVD